MFSVDNYEKIKKEIRDTAIACNRNPEEIEIIGVTKTVSVEDIEMAYNAGIKIMGENKVQEFLPKYEALGNKVKWHFIGKLQTNKVKYIIDKVELIHSVDSFKLAKEIDKRALEHNKVMDILVEINVGDEETKSGISLSEAEDFIKMLSTLENIRVKGLMSIVPNLENVENTRTFFSKLHEKYLDIYNCRIDNVSMEFLSMGMTNDFRIAIEEGATHVRLGRALFGKR